MTMIERVARAMYEATDESNDPNWEKEAQEIRTTYLIGARAAIEALREPTEEMVENGADHAGTPRTAVDTWASMIDAILAEDTNGNR